DEDLLQVLALNEQVFLAGTGLENVHCREDTLVRDLAVQHDFRVAGALELFEDHFIHSAASVDERGCNNREGTALLDIARGTKETLRALQRVCVDTTGKHLAG